MLTLEPMTQAAFDGYVELAMADYAAEGARATGTPPAEAVERSRSQFAALLPEGRLTPGQHFRSVVDAGGAVVGTVWFAEQLEDDPPCVFLYDIRVDETRRGEGLGSGAMRLLEDEARRLGAAEIMLAVFTHNEGAVRLYERLGYRVVMEGEGGVRMALRL